MENATKALLIAAAVLIAIVIIALGVNLLAAGNDTSTEAEKVSNSLQEGIKDQSSGLITDINKYSDKKDLEQKEEEVKEVEKIKLELKK